jgi:two-component system chemotaxis response regulator CheY
MVSAVNQKSKLAECIEAGAMDFIVKPFEKESLRRFFEKHLATDGNVREPRR